MTDRYVREEPIGAGAQAETWRATDTATGRVVVLKIVTLSQGEGVKDIELWERECAVLRTLSHPAIPRYLDAYVEERDGDRAWVLVQSFVEGRNLAAHVAEGRRFTRDAWLDLARQALEVLAYLHGLNPPVVHRDLKPSNLLLGPDGRLALVDFGAVQASSSPDPLGGSTVVGTHGYMPPEQLVGRASPASDLYALGATLVHLASGHAPAALPMERMRLAFRHVTHLDPPLLDWLERLLAPMVEDRPRNAQEARAELDRLLAAPAGTPAAIPAPATPGRARRSKRRWSRIAMALLGLLLIGALVQGLSDRPPKTLKAALAEEAVTPTGRGSIPIELQGDSPLRFTPSHSHIMSGGTPHYVFVGALDWPGPGLLTLHRGFVDLLDDHGEVVDSDKVRLSGYGAPMRPGDRMVVSNDLLPTVADRPARARLRLVTSVGPLPELTPKRIETVRWPDSGVAGVTFSERGRESSPRGDHVFQLQVTHEGEQPVGWLDFVVRAVARDGTTLCRSLAGYGPVTWGVPLRPGEVFPTRKECRWPRDVDHIEIDVIKWSPSGKKG